MHLPEKSQVRLIFPSLTNLILSTQLHTGDYNDFTDYSIYSL